MTTPPRQKLSTESSFYLGAVLGVLTISVLYSHPGVAEWMDERSPLPPVLGAVIGGSMVAAMLVWALIGRMRAELVIALELIPLGIATTVARLSDPDPTWARTLRGVSLALVVATTAMTTLWLGRRYRELDRVLFTEATSAAFFMTAAAAGVYSAAQAFLDAPRLSFAWVPVLAFVSWGVAALVLQRKYA